MGYINSNVGRNMKVERVKRGWTQADLAEASGVSVNSIARYEIGETTPSLEAAWKIAAALGISIDVIAGYEPECKVVGA